VYDCCRSNYNKEREILFTDEKDQYKEEEQNETTRGTGPGLTGINFLYLNGCPANSTVKDKNPLIYAIS